MRSVRAIRVLALTLSIAFVTVARAPVAQADPSTDAKDKFEAGKRSYRLGDYDTAIKEWKEGYLLKDDPVFLFNIAQAYREKKDFENAVKFYENYLKEAKNASNRVQVEARITELKEDIRKREETSHAPPNGPIEPEHPVTVTPVKPPETTPKQPETTAKQPDTTVRTDPTPRETGMPPVADEPDNVPHPGKTMKLAGLVTGGVGVALVATGIVFGLKASSASSDVQAAIDAHQPWTQDLQDKDASGKSASTISVVTLGLGAAAIVGGGVLYFMGVKKDKAARAGAETSRLLILPDVGPTRAGVTVSVRY